MQMSETTMSKICEARRRLAASPLEATSTLWPSFRKLISSSSQMERSSSTINKWAMALNLLHGAQPLEMRRRFPSRGSTGANGAREVNDEFGAFSLLCFHANPSTVSLENLIDDGQSQSRPARESGLEGLEKPVGLARVQADTGIANGNSDKGRVRLKANGQQAAIGHGP